MTYYEGVYDFQDFNVENPTILDDANVIVPEQTSEEVKIEEALPVEEPKSEEPND